MDEYNQKIAEYYDVTLPYYKFFWSKDKERSAIHYGFWDSDTKSLNDALSNQNKFLADVAGINADDKVLDAGCGVGGSAIWLAKNKGARVVGITISQRQLQKAKKLADLHGVGDEVEFYLTDYTNTKFPNESFDVVWGIESICHAEVKKHFLQEAYRILKIGGRLIVADGFLLREPQSEREKKILQDFLDGFALLNLARVDQFKSAIESVGFTNIKFWDKTKEVEPSSKIMYKKVKLFYPLAKILNFLHIIPDLLIKNNNAGIAQRELLKSGLGGYGVFYAEK
ncbi:MAG: hypothetical protein A2445_00730 [Candidatus Jacksonbacteria bacterium RIFOXYC2_FULL_44_29]|nr:MAG: Methyltransferase, UbiE/COQ5 family [Parcubacteria group bacterium GW2011_GWA2_42_28]KKT55466.1 MAG: Methyltransferase, UbiE/COQ5 family [Parcubacteria group bacterium GW2011_GWC2_44_22]OGY75226.1 MAG: hypothetical protein A2240_05825 [Candidatus Jacksonbacteria bacterium RIFOXYA2_FULL_43_12]OGY75929.1 MAG: hypothetical protein A2295_03330 [Candidatus Jacksonbacteria bacterium RIFOXYB2_FULL_44_15]OGY77944.1 MAG: hypothetical protein A2445_00730 [Candidatus Jacksonbacteria bacterium RIFO